MWTVQNGIFATVHNETGDRIATIAASINEHERARLIAAAPELLAALRLMLREHDALQMAKGETGDRWPAATKARAAIARATGEA